MTSWPKLPMAMPGGGLLPHVSGRLRTETIDALFVASGGFERALAHITASEENYGEFFTKVWAKGASRPQSVEVGVSEGVEALLDKLDQAERAQTIDGTCEEVG